MTDHTPGPWTIEPIDPHLRGDFHYRITGQPYGKFYGFSPCMIYGDGSGNAGTSLANANIIAAAPDLLAVCEAALAMLISGPGAELVTAVRPMLSLVIARAKGEQP